MKTPLRFKPVTKYQKTHLPPFPVTHEFYYSPQDMKTIRQINVGDHYWGILKVKDWFSVNSGFISTIYNDYYVVASWVGLSDGKKVHVEARNTLAVCSSERYANLILDDIDLTQDTRRTQILERLQEYNQFLYHTITIFNAMPGHELNAKECRIKRRRLRKLIAQLK